MKAPFQQLIPLPTLLVILLAAALSGCSNRAWYNNLQSERRAECDRQPPSMYEDCMRGADRGYDEYRRERDQQLHGDADRSG